MMGNDDLALAELDTLRTVECPPHFHRLVVRRDLSLVLRLIILQILADDRGVDGVRAVRPREFRIDVERDEQEPGARLRHRPQGRLEVGEVEYPASPIDVEPKAGSRVTVV